MKALLVDLDDTLLDYTGGVDECWLHACEAHGGPVGIDPAGLVKAIVETRRWFWSDPGRHRTERTDMLRAWTRITGHALGRLGRPDETLAGAIAADFAERRWERMTLFPGVVGALEALRARGVPLALVTNGDAGHQRRKIAQHDLERFFDVLVIEGEMGVGKPEAVVFRRALAALGVAAGPDVWMVGDHLEWDIAGSQRVGLRAAWIDRPGDGLPPGATVQPDRIVRALGELARATVTP